jgi:hypothetical protein
MTGLMTVIHKWCTLRTVIWQLFCELEIAVSASSAGVLTQKLGLRCRHDIVHFAQDPGHLHKYSTTHCLYTLLYHDSSILKCLIWFYALLLFSDSLLMVPC